MKQVLFVALLILLGVSYGCAQDTEEDDYEDDYDSEYDDYNYDDEDCKIELKHWYDEFENEFIWDDHTGAIKVIPTGPVKEVAILNNKDNYIDVAIKGDEIIFQMTDKLKNLEYVTRTQRYNTSVSERIEFKCAEGASTLLTFEQPIADKNTHAPFFNRKIYTYKFGMDISAGFDLTDLVDVVAIDIDMTDVELTFSIESNDYLKVGGKSRYDSSNMGKTHLASVTTVNKIVGPFDRKFKIYAKDRNEENTGEAEVHVIIVK